MAMNIGNCPRCGRVFAKGIHEVCPACVKKIEQDYEQCYKYLRENRNATIHELSEATEVTVRQITKFIREGRISLHDMPNMTYPCERCGTMIREGALCQACRKKLTRDVDLAKQLEQEKLQKKRDHGSGTYKVFE